MAKKKDNETDAEQAFARGESPADTRTDAERQSDTDAALAASEPTLTDGDFPGNASIASVPPEQPFAEPPSGPNYTDGPTEPKTERILVWQEGEATPDLEYLHEHARAREVTIGGKPYDHCDTAADGTWIYRNDRKN